MDLKDIKIGMLVGEGFEDLEFWAVYMRMKEENAEITVIGTEAGKEYKSKSGGLTAAADKTAAEINPNDLDVLLVPGGWAPDKLRRDQDILNLVKSLNEQNKILGFICHAGWVAASAGILNGKKCTGSLGIKDDMTNAGAEWVDEAALQDGNLVWGRVVKDIPDYNRLLVEAILNYKNQ
jgi:protease I